MINNGIYKGAITYSTLLNVFYDYVNSLGLNAFKKGGGGGAAPATKAAAGPITSPRLRD